MRHYCDAFIRNMDPREVNTARVLRKVREIKFARKETKQNRQNFINDITDVQKRLTNFDPNDFGSLDEIDAYRAFLDRQENRLNRSIMELDEKIINYNARIRSAQFYAPFDDISLDSD